MAEERPKSVARPTIPPKPKSLSKPSIPPKPSNLNQKISAASPKKFIHTLNNINRTNSPTSTQVRGELSEENCHPNIDENSDIHVEVANVISEEKMVHLENDINSSKNSDQLTLGNSFLTMDWENNRTSNGHSVVSRQFSVTSLDRLQEPVWIGGRRCNGNPPSLCSTDSSSSDVPQDSVTSDHLGKLSDVECSTRSGSSSPMPKCDSYLSQLDSYSPSLASRLKFSDCADTNDVVAATNVSHKESNNMSSSKGSQIYNIANEMMTSEEVFCNVLKLLNVNFRQSVMDQKCIASSIKGNIRSGLQLTEDELNRILNYLPQLQNFSEGLLADLKQRLADWDQHHKIADIIVTKGPFLKMYSCYIRDFEHQCKLLDEACANHPLFAKAVHEFEASDICCKLTVKHYMLKPVQRIPQYRLLFQSYLALLPATSPDTDDARRALTILEDVATHANDTCKIEDKVTQLLSLQRRLVLSDGGQPELIKPGREVLRQGELLKLCRRGMQPRYFVLLSDGLLYTSYNNTMLKLNTELPLEGMKVSKPIADDFSAELTIRATQRSFTLRARSERERDEWLEAVQRAIDANIVRRSTFLAASTACYAAPSHCELGKQAPVWVPDYRVTMCQICTAEFSLTFRRHHCRACGKVVCDLCSSNRAPLEYKKNHAERVCDNCYEVLLKAVDERIENKSAPATSADAAVDAGQDASESEEDTEDAKFYKREPNLSDLKKIKQSFKKGIRDSMRGKSLRKPERLLEVSGNDQGSQMRGYLKRQGQGRRGWYVLKERVLYQYAAPEDVCAIESLPVLGYTLDEKGLECPEPSFTLQHPNQDDIVFVAENGDLALKWVAIMKEATVLLPERLPEATTPCQQQQQQLRK